MQIPTSAASLPATQILNVLRLPGRLTAALLGFGAHDIPALVRAKLLKPIGKPKANCVKWFASVDVEALRNSSKWLDAATKAVSESRRPPELQGEQPTEP